MQRLRERQRVGLGIGQYSLDCQVVALESDEAALLPLRREAAERLPLFSENASLVFWHARSMVMLRGSIRCDPGTGIVFFGVGDGVGQRARRRSSRAELELPVTVTPAGGAPIEGTTVDVSTTGIAVRGEDPGPGGTLLALRLELGDDRGPLECEAEVIRRIGDATAIRFREPSPDTQRRVQRRVLLALREQVRAASSGVDAA